MEDADGPSEDALSVAELAEYCRTQAGLCAGRTETIGAEADALLDEIDADIASLRAQLTHRENAVEGATATSDADPAAGDPADLAALEELEADLEEKQALAEAKRARMAAFRELAEAYTELAEDLEATVEDGRAALERVVRFERDHDAPAYFERQTVLEAAAESEATD